MLKKDKLNKKEDKHRILIVSSSLDLGGAQKMISNITINLPKEWEADILINSDQNIQYSYRGNIISLGIPEPKNRRNVLYQGKVFMKRSKALFALKRKNKYKACISLLDSANIANIITGQKYCRAIITAVNFTSEKANIPVYRYLVFPCIRLLYNKAAKIVAQNTAIRDDLILNFGIREEKFEIIYNGIDITAAEEIANTTIDKQQKEWFLKDRTIITAGRMSFAKGQWHLIRAFSKVVREVPDARLVIYGTGELKEYLEKLIAAYHLKKSVCLKGFDKELDKYIAQSAVFVLPSMFEGMPTVLLEAMACQTACIVTDFRSGAREIMEYPLYKELEDIIQAEYGIITPLCSKEMPEIDTELEQNEEKLADAIIMMLNDSKLREYYGMKGKERSRHFDMTNIISEWLRVIEN